MTRLRVVHLMMVASFACVVCSYTYSGSYSCSILAHAVAPNIGITRTSAFKASSSDGGAAWYWQFRWSSLLHGQSHGC